MSDPSTENTLPPDLRWLKTLVMVLTGVMIAGVVLIVALMIVKLRSVPNAGGPGLLPAQITLPDAEDPQAVTIADTWIGVVTQQGKFLIFDRKTGELSQSFTFEAPQN